jgi:hypothetical protein
LVAGEQYYCTFGLNPAYLQVLETGGCGPSRMTTRIGAHLGIAGTRVFSGDVICARPFVERPEIRTRCC